MNKKKDFVVFSKWLAIKLIKENFNCKNIAPHNNGSGLTVFYFEDTPELHEKVNTLTNNKH